MKTLKDLYDDQGLSGDLHTVSTEELREEAKEWIGEFRKKGDAAIPDAKFSELVHENIIWFIEHFFNLEEKP